MISTPEAAVEWIASLIIERYRRIRFGEVEILDVRDEDLAALGVSPELAEMAGRLCTREISDFVRLLVPELAVEFVGFEPYPEAMIRDGLRAGGGFLIRRERRRRRGISLRIAAHLVDGGFAAMEDYVRKGARIARRIRRQIGGGEG